MDALAGPYQACRRYQGLDSSSATSSYAQQWNTDGDPGAQSCIVGIVGYRQIVWRIRRTSLGYWLAREFQGSGVVTMACNTLVTHAFNDTRLNRVEIRCAVENYKSRAIPQRLGFRQDGVVRDAEWLYDHFVDHIVYRILAHEWTVGTTKSFLVHSGE